MSVAGPGGDQTSYILITSRMPIWATKAGHMLWEHIGIDYKIVS